MKNQEIGGREQEKYIHHVQSFEEMANLEHNAQLSELYKHLKVSMQHVCSKKQNTKEDGINNLKKATVNLKEKIVDIVEKETVDIKKSGNVVFDISTEDLATQVIESIFVDGQQMDNNVLRDIYDGMVVNQVAEEVVSSNPEVISDGYWDSNTQSELYKDMRLGNTHSDMFSQDYYAEEDWTTFTEKVNEVLTDTCQKAVESAVSEYEK